MNIILVANYLPDKQESMNRFARMLLSGFQDEGIMCEIWRPKIFFGQLAKTTGTGIGKWLGYLDKWIIFPLFIKKKLLHRKLRNDCTYFHVCDHSNAPYLKHFPASRTSITCHDVLAIRGALGFSDAYCTASSFGKLLQRWICYHLTRATKVVCDSHMTLLQLSELVTKPALLNRDWRVIHVGFNDKFYPVEVSDARRLLKQSGYDLCSPFLLHVGSGQPRKNRKLLIDMLFVLGDSWKGKICFAGEAIDPVLKEYIISKGVSERVVSVIQPDHDNLLALYTTCEAFIFPSYSEGFGWPLIEAQACGAPVIASNIAPMPEISGGTAIHRNPDEPAEFADSLIWLQERKNRSETVQKGFENVKRFEAKSMTKAYLGMIGLKTPGN